MVIFTKHAFIKLKQREVPKDFVVKTLRNPDYTFSTYSNRVRAYKKFNHLYLKVVFKRESNNFIVITQHWVKTIKELK